MVKIDRAFIRNIAEDQRKLKLLRGIVHLSRELGLKIVVEGVETKEQLALINRHRFSDLVQGYVFSMPVASEKDHRTGGRGCSRGQALVHPAWCQKCTGLASSGRSALNPA
ncbi:EAL domain-containing protein [Neorhizobium galegae]|nr:EAL domain-containing protein [Neorhizobium galegae]